MESLIISLISLSALLFAVSGQFPVLSPSYSISGTGNRREPGGNSVPLTYELSTDIDRQLQVYEESATTTLFTFTSNTFQLSSGYDQAAFTSRDGICYVTTTNNPSVSLPIDTNVWEMYADGGASLSGTYSFRKDSVTYRLEIEDGIPIILEFIFGNTVIILNVDRFTNSTPEFSTFSLPNECSENECDACYSGAAVIASRIIFVVSALLVYLMSAV